MNQLKWIRVLPFKHYYKVKRIELEYDKLHLRWKLCKNYNLNCRYFTLKFPQPNTASKEKFLWNNLAKHVTKTLRTTYEGCLLAMILPPHPPLKKITLHAPHSTSSCIFIICPKLPYKFDLKMIVWSNKPMVIGGCGPWDQKAPKGLSFFTPWNLYAVPLNFYFWLCVFV